jgi:cytochrome P450
MSIRAAPSYFQDWAYITSFEAAEQALRCKDLAPAYWLLEPGISLLAKDILFTLHGDAHFERRRFESVLFRKESLAYYELKVLMPAIHRELSEIQRRNRSTHPPTADLMSISRTALVQVSAALVGLDSVQDRESAQRLWQIGSRTRAAFKVRFSNLSAVEQEAIIDDSLKAKGEFAEAFFNPSVSRRRDLLKGGLPEDEPLDLLKLLISHESASWDPQLMLREAILFLIGSIGTTSDGTAHTVAELWGWLALHPEDRSRVEDLEFVTRASNEAQRLHPGQPMPLRIAVRDVQIGDTRFRAGQKVAIKVDLANRDPQAFPDPHRFDPHRPLTGLKTTGLAFGGGPHMCLGRPMAVGLPTTKPAEDAPVGAIARLVREYFHLGVEPDSELSPLYGLQGDNIETYPVVFTKFGAGI